MSNVSLFGLDAALQMVGWLLTLTRQIQAGLRSRAAFVTWVVANLVLIGVSARAGLFLSIGMYVTNILVCIWSFHQWANERPRTMRSLFVKR